MLSESEMESPEDLLRAWGLSAGTRGLALIPKAAADRRPSHKAAGHWGRHTQSR